MWPQGLPEQSWEITNLVPASVLCVKKQQPERNKDIPRVILSPWQSSCSGCGPQPSPSWGLPPGPQWFWEVQRDGPDCVVAAVACLLPEEASGRPGQPGAHSPAIPEPHGPHRDKRRPLQGPCAPGHHSSRAKGVCVAPCPECGCSHSGIPAYTPAGWCQVVQEPCGSGCACVTLYRTRRAALFIFMEEG